MINFSNVEQSVRALKSQVAAGEIDQQAFESHLITMIDFAPDGCYWMFGHKSERWYRYDGRQWIPDDPGKLRKLASAQNIQAEQDLASLWGTVNWTWFIASLITLGLIVWIVYTSSLV